MPQQPVVVVVSRNSKLAQVRKRLLEEAGYAVVPATDAAAVEQACLEHNVSLILIGHLIEPSEKRRVWSSSRIHCDVPILELRRNGEAEIVDRNLLSAESADAVQLLHSVRTIMQGAR